MITLKLRNIIRKAATEEQAERLERQGYTRTGGAAEPLGGMAAMASQRAMVLLNQLMAKNTIPSESPAGDNTGDGKDAEESELGEPETIITEVPPADALPAKARRTAKKKAEEPELMGLDEPNSEQISPEQWDRIAAAVKTELKTTEEQDAAVRLYCRRAVNRILTFCHREDLPEPLEDTAAQMAGDMLRSGQSGSDEKEIASVTRGDTSITYRDKAAALKETAAFLKDYESQLIPYKKMNLPKGEAE